MAAFLLDNFARHSGETVIMRFFAWFDKDLGASQKFMSMGLTSGSVFHYYTSLIIYVVFYVT
jgi:hypothetical protein